jgi:hypothetical protein
MDTDTTGTGITEESVFMKGELIKRRNKEPIFSINGTEYTVSPNISTANFARVYGEDIYTYCSYSRDDNTQNRQTRYNFIFKKDCDSDTDQLKIVSSTWGEAYNEFSIVVNMDIKSMSTRGGKKRRKSKRKSKRTKKTEKRRR